MAEKFRNKYRIESTRLQNWDYGNNAAYFVTICTKNRIHYFGDIVETQNIASLNAETQNIASLQMQLSEIGKIANQNWLSIPKHFPFVKLGNHVIMPNHVHGIIIIDKPMDSVETQNIASQQQKQNIGSGEQETQGIAYIQHTVNIASWEQETQGIASLPPSTNNKFGPQSNNLASIIRGYKSSVKTYATINTIDFVWQPLFHDHIIKSDNAFHRISEYILNNPRNWKKDTFNK
ncbi:MAG: hypothetical protein ACOH2D_15930 [Gelidibacter sp.]